MEEQLSWTWQILLLLLLPPWPPKAEETSRTYSQQCRQLRLVQVHHWASHGAAGAGGTCRASPSHGPTWWELMTSA